MAEYIEREALQKRLEMHQATNPATIGKKQFQEGYYLGLSEAEIMIAQAPKADVSGVRHARWIPEENGDVYFTCSYCGCEISTSWDYDDLEWNFCPECGCAMDGGADNGE